MENEPKLTQEIEERAVKNDSNSRKFIYIILAVVLIGAGFVAYFRLQKPAMAPVDQPEQHVFREQKSDLSEDQIKVVLAEIEGIEAQLRSLSGGDFSEERDKLYTKLAGAKNQIGEYKDAVESLEKVSEEYKEKTVRVWAYYIMAYRGLSDNEQALVAVTKALALDSENPDYLLSEIEFTLGKSNDEYKQMYERALKKSDEYISVVVSYAWFLEKIGDKAGAISIWQKASEINQNDKVKYEAEISRLKQ